MARGAHGGLGIRGSKTGTGRGIPPFPGLKRVPNDRDLGRAERRPAQVLGSAWNLGAAGDGMLRSARHSRVATHGRS